MLMSLALHATREELDAKAEWVRDAPKDKGSLGMIVVRPSKNQRLSLDECEVSPEGGVHGDNWATECWKKLEDGRSDPEVQVTMINSRLISLLAGEETRQC